MEIYFLSYNGDTIGMWHGEPSANQISEALGDFMYVDEDSCFDVAKIISQYGSHTIEQDYDNDEFHLYSQEIMKGEA